MESQDFQSVVTEAVADNQEAHNTMADYFFTDGPAINGIIVALADAFYEAAIDNADRPSAPRAVNAAWHVEPAAPDGLHPADPRAPGRRA